MKTDRKTGILGKPVHTWKCFDIPDYRGHERYATRSSIQADVILDFSVIEPSFRYNMGNAVQTFIQLTDGANIQKVEEQLLQIEYRESDYIREQKEILQLQPLREMYLHSDHIQDFDLSFTQGSGIFNWILFGTSCHPVAGIL